MAAPVMIHEIAAGQVPSLGADDFVPIVQGVRTYWAKPSQFITDAASFTASGSGATSTAVQTELRRTWYPEHFGAVGDGVTDDAAAWALLLTAVGSSDFEIRGTPGKTYLLGVAGITVTSKTNGRIFGNGAKIKLNDVATQEITGFGSTAIKLDACTRTVFTGWEIDGNSKATNVIGSLSGTDCEISFNKISTGGLNGQIVGKNNTRNRYIFNTVLAGTGTTRGMWLGNYAASSMESDMLVMGNLVQASPATGIVCCSVGGSVQGNRVLDVTGTGSGIIFGGASGFSSKYLTIAGNVCRNVEGHGIQWDVVYSTAADLPVGIIVSGNVCELNDGSGIYAVYGSGSTITGNVCINNNNDASGTGRGIHVDEFENLAITGNYCCDTRSGGSRTQTDGIGVIADLATNNVQNITISGNVCNNNTTVGLNVQNVAAETITGVAINGNTCCDNGSRGLFVTEATASTVTRVSVAGNVCDGNTTTDIRVDILDAAIGENIYTTETGVQYLSFTNADTTPSVKGARKTFRVNNSGATTITAFDDGANGQEIELYFNNANTLIGQGGTINMAGRLANVTPPTGGVMKFKRFDTTWIETYRSFPDVGVSLRATTAVGNVGTGEDNLQSVTLPANTLYVNGRGVRITAWGTKANNADTKTLKLHFGSATILTHALGTSAAGSWKISAEVMRTASGAQDYNAFLIGTDTDAEIGTATQTDTATIVVKCTGEATSNNDIVQEGLIVEVLNA